ncbi:MAG: ATP-binding protein [Muribaculaceae bacterium]|nr:ATP-binding protein [Muribaculaceae bacterium]
MTTEKYPIGIQTFEKLIEGGYSYVDKTRFVEKLVKNDGYYFLSRPRRFGKSLLLSTLHSFFDGKRHLFKDLYIDSADIDWIPSPVLHFDLNTENFKNEDGLSNLLDRLLEDYEEKYSVENKATTLAGRLSRLIKQIFDQTGRKVVILVDEYDKPLLGIEENPELFEKNQSILKAFFGNLKSMDPYIRFALLTGVARFNNVSIFSDLNNLNDISLIEEYGEICGWTEKELLSTFRDGINRLAKKRNETFEATTSALRDYYDGYLFCDEGSRLYNPYSVLKSLYAQKIEPYWFESGSPTFLVNRVKATGIVLPNLSEEYSSRDELIEVGLNTSSPVGLMVQTGYLTIDHYDNTLQMYKLRFPNKEVEIGFAKQLLPLYIPENGVSSRAFSLKNFRLDLVNGNPEKFMERLQILCKIPGYESHSEDNYRNIVWLLCTLCDTDTISEHHSYKGRSDLEVFTANYIYVFEFKYNGKLSRAMAQLTEKDYAGRYALDHRQVYLIAANFSTNGPLQGLSEWEIKRL